METIMRNNSKVVCFGEILIRLTSINGQQTGDLGDLRPYVGGAEANVAVGLSCLGNNVEFVGAVADNDLGNAALNELRKYGVNIDNIAKENGRMGLYFLSPGAMHRPSQIIYDRENSVFAKYDFSKINWENILENCDLLHISGVTAALGIGPYQAALKAMEIAKNKGIRISYDCNYRPKLWENWSNEAPKMILELMEKANILFASHRDIQLVFGENFEQYGDEKEQKSAQFAFEKLNNLELITSTPRIQISASNNKLGAIAFTKKQNYKTDFYDLDAIIDRIGSGDAFAAGILNGILNDYEMQDALLMGLASACLKHAQLGDLCLNNLPMLKGFMNGEGLDVKR